MSLINPFNYFSSINLSRNSGKWPYSIENLLKITPTTIAGISLDAFKNSSSLAEYNQRMKEHYNTTVRGLLDDFFGVCGPGYNYGGATSDSYQNMNLNGRGMETNLNEITKLRMMYRSLTEGISSAQYFGALFKNSSTYLGEGTIIPISLI